MSLPEYLFLRVVADIDRQMDGVRALADQLERHRLNSDAQACVASVAEAADNVHRVLRATQDLRDAAADGLTFDPQPLRLSDVADEVQQRWDRNAVAGGVRLLVSYDGAPETCVNADRARLLQVFDGFLNEAVASVRRTAVEASLRAVETEAGVRLEGRVRGMRDTGWMTQDPELRLAEMEDRLGLGAALDLMLAREIVKGLGGRLWKEAHEGQARTLAFEVMLPAATAEGPVQETVAERPPHVLVVDDNATNRMVAQALCEMFDCTCESAEDGLEAVEAARAGRFDLILMDIRMPNMDGVAASKAIRALPGPAAHVPIIALTANVEPEDAQAYYAAGMNGVVEKPMKAEHLLTALREALEGGRPPARDSAAA